jgi:hypothetical protein
MNYFHEKTVHKIYKGRSVFECSTVTPSKGELFNFELKSILPIRKSWLILDNYGDDIMPRSLLDRMKVVLPSESKRRDAIAIDKRTGQIYISIFHTKNAKILVTLEELGGNNGTHVIPKEYMKRLNELKISKRPFYFTFPEDILGQFLDQEIGLRDVILDPIVSLDFIGLNLEIRGKTYREVSGWIPNAP